MLEVGQALIQLKTAGERRTKADATIAMKLSEIERVHRLKRSVRHVVIPAPSSH